MTAACSDEWRDNPKEYILSTEGHIGVPINILKAIYKSLYCLTVKAGSTCAAPGTDICDTYFIMLCILV